MPRVDSCIAEVLHVGYEYGDRLFPATLFDKAEVGSMIAVADFISDIP